MVVSTTQCSSHRNGIYKCVKSRVGKWTFGLIVGPLATLCLLAGAYLFVRSQAHGEELVARRTVQEAMREEQKEMKGDVKDLQKQEREHFEELKDLIRNGH